MANVKFPDKLEPNTASWEFDPNVRQFESAFTNYPQVVEGQGARWLASFNYINLTQEQQRLVRYIETLPRGTKFDVPAHGLQYGGESQATNVFVSGAGQVGKKVDTTGWGNQEKVFTIGDVVSIGGELKTITKDLYSDDSGQCTLEFEPALRRAPQSAAPVTFNPAIVSMRRVLDQTASLSLKAGSAASGVLTATSIGLEETIY